MKILAVILSILALCWCLHIHSDLRTFKKASELIEKEVVIYKIEPKYKKPAFGRVPAAGWEDK